MRLFTKAFWVTAVESVLTTFATAFLGSWGVSQSLNVHDLLAAVGAGAAGALYAFVKTLGAVQAVNAAAAAAPAKS